MFVTLFGIEADVKPEQPENALFAMFVVPGTISTLVIIEYEDGNSVWQQNCPGMETSLKLEHPPNTSSPKFETLLGILIDESASHR